MYSMTSQPKLIMFLLGAFCSFQTTVSIIVALLQKSICHLEVNCPSKSCSEKTTQLIKSISREKSLNWVLVKVRANKILLFRTQSTGRVTNYLRHNKIPFHSVQRELSDGTKPLLCPGKIGYHVVAFPIFYVLIFYLLSFLFWEREKTYCYPLSLKNVLI